MSGVAVTGFSGVAAAHSPAGLNVQPGNEEKFVGLDDHGTVSVAVRQSTVIDSDGERRTFDPVDEPIR